MILTAFMCRFSVGLDIRGFGFVLNRAMRPGHSYKRHISDIHAGLLETIGQSVTGCPRQCGLVIPAQDRIAVERMLERHNIRKGTFMLLQLSSSARNREWPIGHWTSLIRCVGKQQPVVIADQDREKIGQLHQSLGNTAFIYLPVPIAQYAVLAETAGLIITVETFAGHLGSLLEKKVLCLHSGTTIAAEWGPRGPFAKILQDTSCPLYPCGLSLCSFGHPSPCMKKISVNDALSAAGQTAGSPNPTAI
jgi:ADP-heptose:LPS heptosyltransferase